MKIFLDCSDVDLIKQSFSSGLIDGVTTNPSLMLRNGHDPLEVLKEISDIFPFHLCIYAEVLVDSVEEFVDMAETYLEIGNNITIKVPCTRMGLSLIHI